jgi:large subunit ribosomal protein L7/L12
VLAGNLDVLKNVPIPYVALSDSFSVRSGNARISEANITNWTNPTQESFDALMASVGGTLTINGIATVATPLKWTTAKMGTLNIINSANDILMGPGAFALNATDATLRFPENYLSFAKQIRDFNLNGNCTIKFMSADVLLKWLYVWKQQAGGANVTMAVASDDPAKQSLVTMVNTYISSGQLDVDKLEKKTVITAINKLVTDGYIPAGTAYNDILKEVAGDDLYQQLRYAAGNFSVRLVSAPKHTGTYKILRAVLECTLAEASAFQAAAPCVLKDNLSEESAMKLKNELDAEFVANGYDAVIEVVEGNSAETVDEEEEVETTGTDVQGETASQNTATTTTTTTKTMAVSATAKYDLILTSYGSAKLAVIKAVRECVDLTLAQAKNLVEAAPVTVAKGIDRATAANYKQILEAAGATVEVKLVSVSNSTTTSVTTPKRILSL